MSINLNLLTKGVFWYYFEQLFRSFGVVVVSIYVARYLQPEKFGLLSYSLVFTAIFMGVARLGMDSILIREIGNAVTIKEKGEIITTSFLMMFVSALLCIGMVFISAYVLNGWGVILGYIMLISMGMIFQSFLVVDYWCKAEGVPVYTAMALSLSHLVNATIKVILVLNNSEFFYFIVAHALEMLVIAVFMLIVLVRRRAFMPLSMPRIELVKPLLATVWPLVLSAVAIVLYMRVDQVFIAKMLGEQHLGVYAAATRLYEGCVMIFAVFSAAILPILVKFKSEGREIYEAALLKLFKIGFWGGVLVSVLLYVSSDYIIYYLFGPAYSEASEVLSVLALSISFTALGSLTARYLLLEGWGGKIAVRTLVALLVNVVLNLILIPSYGLVGAAVATLSCIVISNFLIDFFDFGLRGLLTIKLKAIFLR